MSVIFYETIDFYNKKQSYKNYVRFLWLIKKKNSSKYIM